MTKSVEKAYQRSKEMDNKIDLLLSFYKPSNETESQLLEAVRVELKNILEENISLTEHIKNARKERDRWKARAKKRDEILEILKKKLFIEKSDFNFIEDKLELITHSFENVKEKEIIEEWLENE